MEMCCVEGDGRRQIDAQKRSQERSACVARRQNSWEQRDPRLIAPFCRAYPPKQDTLNQSTCSRHVAKSGPVEIGTCDMRLCVCAVHANA